VASYAENKYYRTGAHGTRVVEVDKRATVDYGLSVRGGLERKSAANWGAFFDNFDATRASPRLRCAREARPTRAI